MPANDDWLTGGNRREQAVAAIHAAARAELVERGIDRFSVERVATRAGCSRATLYRVVGGKGALLRTVLADGAARVADRVRVATEGLDGEARVVEAVLVAVER
ncbi:TetR/AcrR family transcriptional regulator, partial [Nocardioides stalactiti]|uniref:TetR/AcrR family transcriptional regulator n=1 Tax=Nocardioides stalactiti TaxID=2755356 RepID=UPI0016045BD8